MHIDLQTHTLASDGRLTPSQLLAKAKKLGFSYIAKTDHDNIDLTVEFIAAGKKFGVHAIPGIEISSRYKNKSVHILGLGIDYKNKKIAAYSEKIALVRRQRAEIMTQRLKQLGWQIKKEAIRKRIITRPDIAYTVLTHPGNKKRLMAEFGCLPNYSTFIRKYMIKGKPAFVPKPFYLAAISSIKLIRNAGGLAIIAHPGSKSPEFNYTKRYFQNLIKLKFDGLEVYSSVHNQEQINYFKKLAHQHKLLISAGSDYHGYDEIHPLGICDNGKYVDEKTCRGLLKRLAITSTRL
jgi:predicted metal-dependent phosphoesterase TrpH